MVSLRSLVAGVALLAAPVMAALTPLQISDGLAQLTKMSQELQPVAASITIVNAPLIVIGQGPFPPLIKGFTEMVTVGTVIIGQTQGTPQITVEADATLVFESFRGFVRVHQALLNILIGKAGILTKVPMVGQPVAAVLRQVEGVVDSIAIFLIDLVESRAKDLESEANSVGESLDLCIQQYEGIQV
ncbi:hypothetical protein C8A01DRAFT_20056 [Parachaetomium inaequale]|uniref:Uncharacterized protein n=1 Tax=Parachaetomium inaequale TaxID=2588326 RepID=A0AAN6SMV3_9PEZI|nr:hypothetical protein C8A01DRAFT_20056 [Parachaetomium inaequale]